MKETILLSVIIPCKNEASHIGGCLDSLAAAIPSRVQSEIIIADCASTDDTVAVASRYPVTIVRLKPSWVHTASAARFIGGLYARGEFLLFIDADMTLERGFLERALDMFSRRPAVAAVTGIGIDRYYADGAVTGTHPDPYRRRTTVVTEHFYFGGAAVYRARALKEAGGFNPYLYAGEENELGQRLRLKGHTLVCLPDTMITHHTASIGGWEEFLRKRKAKLFFGIGQALRVSHSWRYRFESLGHYKSFTLFLAAASLGVCAVSVAFFLGRRVILPALVIPAAILYAYLALKKRSLILPAISMIKLALVSADILRGIMSSVPAADAYPRDPDIIQGNRDANE